MADCSALMSSGTAIITKTAGVDVITNNAKQQVIIDNISINGNARDNNGIYTYGNAINSTFNTISVYNTNLNAIRYLINTKDTTLSHHTINNSLLYNN